MFELVTKAPFRVNEQKHTLLEGYLSTVTAGVEHWPDKSHCSSSKWTPVTGVGGSHTHF